MAAHGPHWKSANSSRVTGASALPLACGGWIPGEADDRSRSFSDGCSPISPERYSNTPPATPMTIPATTTMAVLREIISLSQGDAVVHIAQANQTDRKNPSETLLVRSDSART